MRVILQADDCGLSRNITENILACLDQGVLNGAGVITGGSYAQEALEALGKRPTIFARVHLNLLEGRPTAPPSTVAPLVGKDGFFRYSLGRLCLDLLTLPPRRKKALLHAIRTELSAQIDFFKKHYGQDKTLRLDGHQHIQAIPWLNEILRSLIREYQPAYIRLPLEPRHHPPCALPLYIKGSLRRHLLASWSLRLKRMLDEEGVAHNRFLAGVMISGSLTLKSLSASLEAIRYLVKPDEVVEIMCHPGGVAGGQTEDLAKDLAEHEKADCIKPSFSAFYTSPWRELEKKLLFSPELKSLLAEAATW